MTQRNPGDRPLREALEALERDVPDVPAPQPQLRGRRPRWQVLLLPTAATLVAGVLIGALATQWLLSNRGVGGPTPAPSVPTSASASASTATLTASPVASIATPEPSRTAEPAQTPEPPPTPTPLTLAAGWSYEAFGNPPTQDGPDQTWSASVVDAQVVVAGSRPTEGVLWVLGANGFWTEAGRMTGEESLGNYQLQRIASSNGVLVAAGTRYAIDYAIPELWWSADRSGSWTQAVGPSSASPACGQLTDLTTTDSGFLAVGYTCTPPGALASTSEALVYTSPDGRTWGHRTLPGSAGGGLNGVARMGSRIVAIGFRGTDTLVLTSDDAGATWTERGLPPVDGDASLQRVIGGPDGFVILGYVSQPNAPLEMVPAVWSSADGASWAVRIVGSSPAFPNGIVQTPTGYAIVGEHLSDTGSNEILLWTSRGLASWSAPITVARGHLMSAIGVVWSDNRLVIVGEDSPAEATYSRPMSLIHAGSLP